MDERERKIRAWFELWLRRSDEGIEELFTPDTIYIESWGPEYHGLETICHWFREWNTRGRVLQWDIRQFFHKGGQTVAEWYFRFQMDGGQVGAFEGMSLVRWSEDGMIRFMQEFGCNENRYDPYENGPAPQFRDEKALWF